jgi:hypothetical protein
MSKIDLLNEYISKCEEIIISKNLVSAYMLSNEITSVFYGEIHDIELGLSIYGYGDKNHYGDIIILKAKLINYKTTLELEETRRKDEIEILRLKQPISTATYHNVNSNSSNAISNATNNVSLLIHQTIENITNLNEDTLSDSEKNKLDGLLNAIEMDKKSKDKEKLLEKVGGILKFIADKSVQVGIAVLPYLGEVSEFIATI